MDTYISPVCLANINSNKRYVVNQGGMRSGKTFGILEAIILKYILKGRGLIIDIARKTQAELRDSVVRDFFNIIQKYEGGLRIPNRTKTGLQYKINGNEVSFIGIDKPQKKRGPQRNILFLNEANGVTLDDWVQLSGRTSGQIYLDFNPSEYFWVNEQILEKDSSKYDLIQSTYLDNYDFLEQWQREEIENLINVDDYYYKVYVLGELAIMKGKIYNNYRLIEPSEYDDLFEDEKFYGLDFGYEHATSLMEIKYCAEQVYDREIYHETHKMDDDLIRWMQEHNISQTLPIYADHAYPASIRKLRDAGYNVHKANKDVKDGIRFCQALKRNICKSSTHYIKSINKYKFKQTADGVVIDFEPVKIDDDPCDAARYGEFTHLRKRIMSFV
jgi:phage terminase large subunit